MGNSALGVFVQLVVAVALAALYGAGAYANAVRLCPF